MDFRTFGLGSRPNSRASHSWAAVRPVDGQGLSDFPSALPRPDAIKFDTKGTQADTTCSLSSNDNGRHDKRSRRLSHRKPNPGIDVALRNLNDEVSSTRRLYKAVVDEFELQISELVDWADGDTLEEVWKNKFKHKSRDRREGEKLGGVCDRLCNCRASIQDAIAKAQNVKALWKDKHELEAQIRTAKKAVVYCDGLIDLATKSAIERKASRQLIQELAETNDLLQRKKYPWIYGYVDATEKLDDAGGSKKDDKAEAKLPKAQDKLETASMKSMKSNGKRVNGRVHLSMLSDGTGGE
ncbi:hypothetical protein QBC47DRAFT_413917 [Echria macrotheca]|uniref:Uncharacterized protein n=1 Tax=Echria macrotheca TaxID=438768 RepID=A0AAJ0BBY1_9PEZI|nr:hypothetical protein QBC47DRAFT_413917 [Echria macrotheca]